MSYIEGENIRKVYHRGEEEVVALHDISLSIEKGSFIACIGPSGSGKTTLVNILGCLDNPTHGTLHIDRTPIFATDKTLSEYALTKIRREHFGYIFQNFYLISTLTVAENIMVPYTFYKKTTRSISDVATLLGINHRLEHRPHQLSGGEMQRVAIARALINNPAILLADEPTGNLDTARTEEIGGILRNLNKHEGLTIIMVTHNLDLARSADHVFTMKDGRIIN